MNRIEAMNRCDYLKGCVNRMMVTDDWQELHNMPKCIEHYTQEILKFNERRLRSLKKGDRVVMNDHYTVPDCYAGKIWEVASEPWDCCGTEVVKLKGKSGSYAVDGLDLVRPAEGEADAAGE